MLKLCFYTKGVCIVASVVNIGWTSSTLGWRIQNGRGYVWTAETIWWLFRRGHGRGWLDRPLSGRRALDINIQEECR